MSFSRNIIVSFALVTLIPSMALASNYKCALKCYSPHVLSQSECSCDPSPWFPRPDPVDPRHETSPERPVEPPIFPDPYPEPVKPPHPFDPRQEVR